MTRLRLYAIVPADVGARIEAGAATLPVPGIHAIRGLDLAAIVGPPAHRGFFGASKKELATEMVAFQRLLEALLVYGRVLPAAFGSEIDTSAGTLALLIAHASALRGALAAFGDKQQFQVAVLWDPKQMLRRLAGTERLAPLAGLSPATEPSLYARALFSVMEGYRAELARSFLGMLGEVAVDLLEMPTAGPDDIVNATVLIEPARLPILEAVIEAIDARASDALHIKFVGPLPACAFASLRLEKPDAERIAAARVALQTGTSAQPDVLKRAYRERLRLVHPDLAPGHEGEAAEAGEAYDLLRRISEAEAALAAEGVTPASAVPLVRLLRADRPGVAA